MLGMTPYEAGFHMNNLVKGLHAMSWQDLLGADTQVCVPWTGGRLIWHDKRKFEVKGNLPKEHGWHLFTVSGGRTAKYHGPADDLAREEELGKLKVLSGYAVGDRLVPDDVQALPDAKTAMELLISCEPIALLDDALSRFTRVKCVRWMDGRLIFASEAWPIGPEPEVQAKFEDRAADLDDLKGIVPALRVAFLAETWSRAENERQRAEAERLAREEEARQKAEEERQKLANSLGTGAGRRAMAQQDFETAARAALAISGAELLDWRKGRLANEAVVRFRFGGERFECVCRKDTLRIVESGICLVDHGTGKRGDELFTLESLPPVILQAKRGHKLVRFRHVD